MESSLCLPLWGMCQLMAWLEQPVCWGGKWGTTTVSCQQQGGFLNPGGQEPERMAGLIQRTATALSFSSGLPKVCQHPEKLLLWAGSDQKGEQTCYEFVINDSMAVFM